jgi:hypothetical protein
MSEHNIEGLDDDRMGVEGQGEGPEFLGEHLPPQPEGREADSVEEPDEEPLL